jgi:hypothetical protein
MAVKRIWIVSKHSWSASLRSEHPAGDTSWFTLSKFSGAANYPAGEWVEVTVMTQGRTWRKSYIDVTSNASVITVLVMKDGYRLRYVSPVCQQGGWILDGGRWNDEGVWDDGEYWED